MVAPGWKERRPSSVATPIDWCLAGSGSWSIPIDLAWMPTSSDCGPSAGRLILLDEGGVQFSSSSLSDQVRDWAMDSEPTHLAIGPASGFDGALPDVQRISLSQFTFPHELATIVLLEQLYRAYEITGRDLLSSPMSKG